LSALQAISIFGYSFHSFSHSLEFRGKRYQQYQFFVGIVAHFLLAPAIAQAISVSRWYSGRIREGYDRIRGTG